MQFPAGIELCRAGYSRTLSGAPSLRQFDAWSRRRRRVRMQSVTDSVCFVCTDSQRLTLEQFHRDAGGDLFMLALPDWQGVNDIEVRFNGPLSIRPVADYYEITCTVQVPEPVIMPRADLDSVLLTGVVNQLHHVIHSVMPALLPPIQP